MHKKLYIEGQTIQWPNEKGQKTCNNLQNNAQKAVYRRIDNTMAKRKGTKTCKNLQNNTQKAVNRRIDNTK